MGRLWEGILFFRDYLVYIFFLAFELILQFVLRVDDVWVFRWHGDEPHTDATRASAGPRVARSPLQTFMFGRW